jgi:hypothetical protein
MPLHRSPGVSVPWVGVLQLPSRVPPRVGIPCAYLSWFISVIELNRLPGKLVGEPCMRVTVGGPVDVQLIL